jgi:SAM-dependent methyltransferase
VPGSFYNSFLPKQSVDVLFSTTALHYASKCASPLKKHVYPSSAEGPEELAAWTRLSESDLHTAMSNIHDCLRPGGKFWAVVPGHSQHESTGKLKNCWYREVLDVMCEQLLALVKSGVIDEKTWNNFVLPVHARHLNEWQAWFDKNGAMFKLEFLYGEDQANPYLERFRKDHKDPDRFADEYLSSVRAWSDRIIAQILPDQEQRHEFYEGLRQQFKQDPERFENDSYSVYIGATRL